MTLTQLSYVIAVDTYKHFATAADKCFVTQPTLSMQIHKLEEELGVQLFNRRKQPIEVTEIGRKVIDQARIVYREAVKIDQLISLHKGNISGPFRLGVIPTVAPSLVPRFVQHFQKVCPEVNLIVEEMQTKDIIDRLNKDLLDAAIAATPLQEKDIKEQPLYYEPFKVFIPKDHGLAEQEEVTPDDLNVNELLLLHEGHCFRNNVISLCRKKFDANGNNAQPLSFESGNFDTLRRLVERGMGITLLPDMYLQDLDGYEQRKAVIRSFGEPVPGREVSLIFRKEQLKKQIIEMLRDTIIKNVPQAFREKSGIFVVEPR